MVKLGYHHSYTKTAGVCDMQGTRQMCYAKWDMAYDNWQSNC